LLAALELVVLRPRHERLAITRTFARLSIAPPVRSPIDPWLVGGFSIPPQHRR